MQTMVFINVAVEDLKRSMDFFGAMGYGFNMHFTTDDAACLVISDTIFVMLLRKPFFQGFTTKTLVDSTTSIQTIVALSAESREAVDTMLGKALAAGATEAGEAKDYGFMYYRSFYDIDGHMWEYTWMDPAAAAGEAPPEA